MRRRRTILAVVLVLVAVLLVVFILVGIPLIQQTFTPPITGLPTTGGGSSLRDRYTQTAQAKTSAGATSATQQAPSS